jgi:tRNA threonylcarbamoyladenosine biosynthesis protein TsaE
MIASIDSAIFVQMNPITINSLPELTTIAERLLYFANGEKFFVLEGEMAAGKTTFIKALCALLGVKDVVSSPTFSIVNEYDSANGLIYHFDFYRLKSLQEAFDIGYEEYFYSGDYCLVEWPQKVEELLPETYIKVEIEITGDLSRSFKFSKIG